MEPPLTALRAIAIAGVACACSSSGGDQVRDRERATQPSGAAPRGEATPAPTSFTIEYRSRTHFPTCRGNQRIKVDAQGGLFAQTNDRDCPTTDGWSAPYGAPRFTLTADERARLARVITDSGVLALPPLTTDPKAASTDGHRDELEIDVSGRHVVVAVDQTTVPAFAQVRQALIDLASR
ncbi:MAG TPA: hypothetical protein VFK02_05570 [Kofleriaceae bacterium]|nr:hypothetical protein [Kofleriaceae bacterium]